MPPISNESNKNKLRNELDGLMNSFNETFKDNSISQNASDIVGKKLNDIAKPPKTYDINMEELDLKFKGKAKDLINSMFDFYLDSKIIDRIEYTKAKRDLDTSNLSNMLWQLKTVKITISILMDEITSGNTNQKTISALSDMQARFSEIIRMQANYVLFLEDTYKKMKYEASESESSIDNGEQARIEQAKSVSDSSEFFLTASPKELIRQITEVSPLTDDEHAQMRIDGEDCIHDGMGTKNTDPKLKEELMTERNIVVETKTNSDDSYDSILNMI